MRALVPVALPSMTDKDARKLGTQIVKESSGLIVKFGQTNGRACLHLTNPGFASTTIYSPVEWEQHPENRRTTRRRRPAREEAVAA